MNAERWRQVEALFQSALGQEAPQRATFLREVCGGDADLRHEVESLLRAHEAAGSFMEGRADAADGETGTREMLRPGTRLGPYEVVGLLATGGMGEVYRARDTRLGREVAVKTLPRASLRDPGRRRRFEQEARAAGALSHPNILAVHDVGDEDGLPYVVTELLNGETLRARLRRQQPLPVAEALGYARQIASGLAAAHEKGVVHRDLKPGNVFVTVDGQVKILDFGLAKQLSAGLAEEATEQTSPGTLLGTAGYMSPEQVRGQPADHRSDIFSFGAVLYEMLAGRQAFGADSSVEAMSAILKEEPDLSRLPPAVPAAVEDIVRRCLEKEPARRFPSTRALLAALEDTASSSPADPRQRSVAVLPFRDLAQDPAGAQLGLGLADATITELAGVGALLVRPTSAILRFQDRDTDPAEAARELAVDAVVDGSFQRAGERLRVTVQLVGADGRTLWAAKLDTSLADIFGMQDEVSRSIARALEVRLSAADLRRRGQRKAPAGDAYEQYLKGKAHFHRETLEEFIAAVDCFDKARELDPGFAEAWAGLADAYARISFNYQPDSDWYPRAQAACERALALSPGLPEGRHVRAYLRWCPQGGWDHAAALRDLTAALAGRPNLDDAHMRLGVVLYHVGLVNEALPPLERALAICPENTLARYHVGFCRYHQGRYEEALVFTEEAERAAAFSWVHYQAALCLIRLGRLDDAAHKVEFMTKETPGKPLAFAIRGLIAALGGDERAAHEHVRLTIENRKAFGHYHHAQYEMACIHALLGEKEEAVRWLADAAANGYPCLPLFRDDPLLVTLRGHDPYERLLDRLREEHAGYARLYAELSAGSGESTDPVRAI